jgi:hypothetical protein
MLMTRVLAPHGGIGVGGGIILGRKEWLDCGAVGEKAMAPHLFVRKRPPAVHGAALGDLSGALGAALLGRAPSATPRPDPPLKR